MANVIIIAGDTGTGKSRSLMSLNPKETAIINVLNKKLPFKGSSELYSIENKNIFHMDKWNDILATIKGIPSHIKNVIIDDVGYVMTGELFDRSSEKGYEKFTDIGKHIQQLLVAAKNIPSDINIVFMFHTDDDVSDRIKIGKKLKTIGMMLEDKYNPLGVVTIALFTEVSYNAEGLPSYSFITNRINISGVVIPAKSPEGMFPVRIPNDLSIVFQKINEYYK